MKNGNLSPVYIFAEVSFMMDGTVYTCNTQLMNSRGTIAFPWKGFDPILAVGKPVKASFTTKTRRPVHMTCSGFLFSEQTESSSSLGIGFTMSEAQRHEIDEVTKVEGSAPSFARKFPRIPFIPEIKMMPSRALARFVRDGEEVTLCPDVDNLSPSGIQLYGDDPRLGTLVPGRVLYLELVPRCSYLELIQFEGAIRRLTRTLDTESQNPAFHLGMSIGNISDESKMSFAILLREIVGALVEVNRAKEANKPKSG